MSDVITTRSEGGVLEVTLDRPKANAIDLITSRKMGEIFQGFRDDPELRVAIIQTAGDKFFCAGWDLKAAADGDAVDGDYGVGGFAGLQELRNLNKPVIAAVNGPAAGAGFSLALMCDTRIASEEAFFAVAYGRIGASPDGGMTYFLPRLLGPARAVELMLNDPNLSAEEALEAGLIANVVPAEELMAVARAKATQFAAMSPHYVRMTKALVGQSLDNGLADHLQLERDGIADGMATEDLQNGIRAFLAREEVKFTGR